MYRSAFLWSTISVFGPPPGGEDLMTLVHVSIWEYNLSEPVCVVYLNAFLWTTYQWQVSECPVGCDVCLWITNRWWRLDDLSVCLWLTNRSEYSLSEPGVLNTVILSVCGWTHPVVRTWVPWWSKCVTRWPSEVSSTILRSSMSSWCTTLYRQRCIRSTCHTKQTADVIMR